MCKEIPVIPMYRVVDKKRIIINEGPRRMGPPPPQKKKHNTRNSLKIISNVSLAP
jgi:hypothetical protein